MDTGDRLTAYTFIGMCRCTINNKPEHATHTQSTCPLHGEERSNSTDTLMWQLVEEYENPLKRRLTAAELLATLQSDNALLAELAKIICKQRGIQVVVLGPMNGPYPDNGKIW